MGPLLDVIIFDLGIYIIILLTLSGIVSSTEVAFLDCRRSTVKTLADEGKASAKKLLHIKEHIPRYLSTLVICNNIINIAGSIYIGNLAAEKLGDTYIGIFSGIMTLLVILYAEDLPKNLGTAFSLRLALFMAYPIYYLALLLSPILKILNFHTSIIRKILGIKGKPYAPTEEEIYYFLEISQQSRSIKPTIINMLKRVFHLDDLKASQLMVPRKEVEFININDSYETIMNTFKEENFSRYPVIDEEGEIIGIILSKELLDIDSTNFDIKNFIKKPVFISEYKKGDQILREMRARRMHMFNVINEHGDFIGIITMEDIIEEIFGEIYDEFDDKEDDENIEKQGNELLVEGTTEIHRVEQLLNTEIDIEDASTINRLLSAQLERIPRLGDVVQFNNIEFTVKEADKTKAVKVLLKKLLN